MSFNIKPLHGGGLQVHDNTDHRIIFSLDELRSHASTLKADMVEGTPKLPAAKADLLVWAACRATLRVETVAA